jgi:hypothetical protein
MIEAVQPCEKSWRIMPENRKAADTGSGAMGDGNLHPFLVAGIM